MTELKLKYLRMLILIQICTFCYLDALTRTSQHKVMPIKRTLKWNGLVEFSETKWLQEGYQGQSVVYIFQKIPIWIW